MFLVETSDLRTGLYTKLPLVLGPVLFSILGTPVQCFLANQPVFPAVLSATTVIKNVSLTGGVAQRTTGLFPTCKM